MRMARMIGSAIYGAGLVCAVVVLAGGAVGLGVIVAHCAIFGMSR